MSDPKPDFETLNAYVDGELEPPAAAAVARAAAEHAGIADQVAKLHAMKAAVRNAYDTPPIITIYPSRAKFSRLAGGAMAAGLAIAVVAGGLWLGIDKLSQPTTPGNVFAAALSDHDQWTAEPVKLQPITVAAGFTLPDLMLSGLRVEAVETDVRLNGIPATHIGYVGHKGCHLSLYVLHMKGVVDVGDFADDDLLHAESWMVGNTTYLAIARRMDPVRFTTISHALRLATEEGIPLDQRVRTALAKSHQPCVS